MAHLGNSFSSYATFLAGADSVYAADLTALNNSGVNGTVLFSVQQEEDGSGYINVALAAEGLTANQAHGQHVHGLFDDGTPIDSFVPSLADDADRDGMVEVFEGLPQYGDILLPLVSGSGDSPVADMNGELSFVQSYAIDDPSNFFSPVTNTSYDFSDIVDLFLRVYVIHGVEVPDGIGEGTDNEVNGTGGYIPLLPAAAAEIEQIDIAEASRLLDVQRAAASDVYFLGDGDDSFAAGAGDDTVFGGAGDDTIDGEGDDDFLVGQDGNDLLLGKSGNDLMRGGLGNDVLAGYDGNDTIDGREDDDEIYGGLGDDLLLGDDGQDLIYGGLGNDTLAGNAGDDTVDGRLGDDLVFGGTGNDFVYGGGGDDTVTGREGDDMVWGGDGNDEIRGHLGDDALFGGAGEDTIWGGFGADSIRGDDGDDLIAGREGDDLLVGGAGNDTIYGGEGLDIIGGLSGNDLIRGGEGADEFHFDAGTGTDTIADFQQGVDVISLLNGGAVQFANSTDNDVRGDSNLAIADFAEIANHSELSAASDQKVLYSYGGLNDLMTGSGGAEVEAYIAATDGNHSYLVYDSNWSDLADREMIARIDDLTSAMTVSDFDIY